jgi:hypothetical protein
MKKISSLGPPLPEEPQSPLGVPNFMRTLFDKALLQTCNKLLEFQPLGAGTVGRGNSGAAAFDTKSTVRDLILF